MKHRFPPFALMCCAVLLQPMVARDPVIIALGLFLLAGVLTANTVANDISGALIP